MESLPYLYRQIVVASAPARCERRGQLSPFHTPTAPAEGPLAGAAVGSNTARHDQRPGNSLPIIRLSNRHSCDPDKNSQLSLRSIFRAS